jgi:uncharacterized membrane protein
MTLLRGHYGRTLWLVIGLGVAVRLVLAFTTDGVHYDLEAYRIVGDALLNTPSRVYAIANGQPHFPRWPYPPGYFPFILAADGGAHLTGLDFFSLVRVPFILSDAAIAWIVQDFLGRRGADHGRRLAAAALVALGPSFVAISGFHGQLDPIAILPAVAALALWDRTDASWRPYAAGALIGVGGSIKTVPLLMLLALLPSARSRGEGVRLLASAGVVALVAIAPWLATAGTGWLRAFRYNGAPGLGSLSLVAQPDLAPAWFGLGHARLSDFSQALYDHSRLIAGVAILAAGALVLRFRAPATTAAVLLWLTVYVFGVTFFMQYMVWGLPFFLMAGYLREVLLLQAVLLGPTLVTYVKVSQGWLVDVLYVVPMLAVWTGMAVSLVLLARRVVIDGRARAARA